MEKLTISTIERGNVTSTHKVTGFQEGELQELKRLPHGKAEEKLLQMLDERNGGCGTMYKCGYGIYGVWFDNEAAYFRAENSCD